MEEDEKESHETEINVAADKGEGNEKKELSEESMKQHIYLPGSIYVFKNLKWEKIEIRRILRTQNSKRNRTIIETIHVTGWNIASQTEANNLIECENKIHDNSKFLHSCFSSSRSSGKEHALLTV